MTGARKAWCALALALGATVALLAPVSALAAAEPAITSPAPGYTQNASPTFMGTSNDSEDPLTVYVYPGPAATGTAVETLTPLGGVSGGHWSASSELLAEGQYTALAEQAGAHSLPVTFTVDDAAPKPTMSTLSPYTNHSDPTLKGTAGTAPGDLPAVTVRIFAGGSASGSVGCIRSGHGGRRHLELHGAHARGRGVHGAGRTARPGRSNVGLSPAAELHDRHPAAGGRDRPDRRC